MLHCIRFLFKMSSKEQPAEVVSPETETSFTDFNLDDRLYKAICDLGWTRPTLIQEKAIPLALEGKDILARGRTGSGKTAAFLIPIIQKILERKTMLASCCSREIRVVLVSTQNDTQSERSLLSERPDVVIGTPSRVLANISAGSFDLSLLEFLVVDEADLMFSFGYESDVRTILRHLPKIYQAFLTSATLTDDVKALKKLLLHNPVTLRLAEAQLPDATQLTQYHIKCQDDDRFLLLYALLKLRLIRNKTIVFVNTINRGYRLKLYLEQFGIPTCILNSELPVTSRCHVVQQFNEGIYDYIIATDETSSAADASLADQPSTSAKARKEKLPVKKKIETDPESGVSRGIDFYQVSNVINFDFPRSIESYIHRVGRTARGWNHGTALSFASDKDMPRLQAISELLSDQMGTEVFKPYQFRMEELDGFRYRSMDALQAVTTTAVREARLKEIRQEILQSEKLRSYFVSNPRDFELLRHDRSLHTVKIQPHLQSVPEYIVPSALRGVNYSAPLMKKSSKKDKAQKNLGKKARMSLKRKLADAKQDERPGRKKFLKKKSDPLQSFSLD